MANHQTQLSEDGSGKTPEQEAREILNEYVLAFDELPEHMGRMQLIRIAYAARDCMEVWQQGRMKQLMSVEHRLIDQLGVSRPND